MELPKNIVQIGKPDKVHKIYIEDYVVSYIKQLNRTCEDKSVGLALYGNFFEEEGCKFYFLYGAAKIEGLQHRGVYLSQAEKDEIADVGSRFFAEYVFLAWCNLNGEPVEKLYALLQGKGEEAAGYACFYERNESMLNYMLLLEQTPEEKRETIAEATHLRTGTENKAARGEWRASDYMRTATKELPEQKAIEKPVGIKENEKTQKAVKNHIAKKTDYMRMAAVGLFLVLCVIGITTLNDYGKLEDLQVVANQVIANMTEQKLPDENEENIISGGNAVSGNVNTSVTPQPVMSTQEPIVSTPEPVPTAEVLSQAVETVQTTPQPQDPLPEEKDAETETVAAVQEYTAYTVTKGDTLISICIIRYGSLDRMREICELNGITDADNIQVGQTILLP